jgi:hypothetical protein
MQMIKAAVYLYQQITQTQTLTPKPKNHEQQTPNPAHLLPYRPYIKV